MSVPETRRNGILAGPLDDSTGAPIARTVAAVPGTTVLHRATRITGTVLRCDRTDVVVRDARGTVRRFTNADGQFAVDGMPVRLVPPSPSGSGDDVDVQRSGRLTDQRTASGSRAVVGARPRVARAARILVEGIHDAELVEHVWGDDLRLEGIVVERMDGADHLPATLATLRPAPGRRVGVLLDHLVPGTKEARLAASVADPNVLVTGTPYVDIWEAVRPTAIGISAWPVIPRGIDWKTGMCGALGFAEPRDLWRHIRASVRDWTDLEQPLVRAMEQLIDFVTGDA